MQEPETVALEQALADDVRLVSSIVAAVEVPRAAARFGVEALQRARTLLGRLDLVALDEELARVASDLSPPKLRALDSIHVASALRARVDLDVVISYDERMLGAASAAGLPVAAPGR